MTCVGSYDSGRMSGGPAGVATNQWPVVKAGGILQSALISLPECNPTSHNHVPRLPVRPGLSAMQCGLD